MYQQNYISIADRDYALSFPAQFNINQSKREFGYIADRIAHLVPILLSHVPKDVIVKTNINSSLQTHASLLLKEYIAQHQKEKNISQASFIALNDQGAILAMVGGKDYQETPFNRTTHAFRQSGSAFKPFIYMAAFEKGYHPDTLMMDKDVSFRGYRPQIIKINIGGK